MPASAPAPRPSIPGYGFLSENEEFAEALAANGITFIGPPASAIRAMGSKSEAKKLMGTADVPLTPGYHGDDQTPELLHKEADRHRLPGADQGGSRRRRQGHAPGREVGRFPRRAGLVQARGDFQLRRRPRADREVHHQAAPHRDPGLRRHAGQLRLPVRARLLGAAPPPEGAGGGARPRHAGRAPPPDGRSRRRRRQGGRLRRRRHGRVHRHAGRHLLLHGDEHPPAGRAPGHRNDHRPGSGRMAAARRRRPAAAAAAGTTGNPRPCAGSAHLRRGRQQGLPARHRQADPPRPAGRDRSTCASIPASRKATRSRPSTTR